MTVNATAPLSGPYTANGTNRLWDFGFKVTAANQIALIYADDVLGTNAVIVTTGFDFPTPSDIGSANGGTLRYPISPVAPLANGKVVRLIRVPIYEQPDPIGNQGDFYPETVEGALDRLTMLAQDLNAKFARVPLAPVGQDGNYLISTIIAAAAVGASDAAAVQAALAAASASAASSSATASANSATASAGSATTATTQAGLALTRANAASAAQVAAEAARDATLTAYDSFDDRYLGAKAVAPTLDNDGNALIGGTLYFDTVGGAMMLWTGSAWVAAYVSGSGYLAAANNLSDLASAATARTNLGLSANGSSLVTAANYATMKTLLVLAKADVGLGNVDNTSDATKNSAVATLTNKRVTARVFSEASNTASAPASDSYDQHNITALAAADAIANPTGTPTDGQTLIIRIKDSGTARALTWGTEYRAMGNPLPTTTTISKTMYCGFKRNAADSKWDLIALTIEA